jgi:hypothetical protein
VLPRLEAPHAGAASRARAAPPPPPHAMPLDASPTTSSLLPASVLSGERETNETNGYRKRGRDKGKKRGKKERKERKGNREEKGKKRKKEK